MGGDPKIVKTGKVAVADLGYALKLMADSFYPTILPAIKELVTNAVEAKARQVRIVIYKASRRPFILVEDDGEGMSKEFLGEVAEKICDSIKREQKDLTGEHGVGMPTAASKLDADLLQVASKPRWQGETYTLEFPLAGKQLAYQVFEELSRARFVQNQGTKVYLVYERSSKGLDSVFRAAGIRKKEGTSRLAEYLGQAFGRRIDKRKLTICIERPGVGGGTAEEYVQPIKYLGTPIELNPISTRFGEICFELYCKHPKSRGTITIQHHTAPLVTDITELADFRGSPWDKFEGEITAVWLERTGGGVATGHKTFLVFRQAVKKEVEARLREFHREVTQESLTADEVGKLRQAFKLVLGSQTTFMSLPKTLVASAEGRIRSAQRSSLGQERGPIKEKGAGRAPYAAPDKTPIIPVPISKQQKRKMRTVRVSALQWYLGPFREAENHLYYKLEGGVIFINTAHPAYIRFVNPTLGEKSALSRKSLKLYWMALITCYVLVDLNMPVEEYGYDEREMQFGILYASISTRL